jgi:2,5-diketo-D-gluconate reductase A
MEEAVLLGDGRPMPLLGFGTYLSSSSEVIDSCEFALECGYRHIDTAQGYRTEAEVGVVLKNKSPKPFITTKLSPGKEPNEVGYDDTLLACQRSLETIGIESIDLFLIHAPFGGREGRLEQWRALMHFQSLGKCKSIGVSNFSIKHLEELKEAGLAKPAANQIELHPLCQHRDIVNYCLENNILPIAYSSLAPLSSWRPEGRSGKPASGVDNTIYESLASHYNITPAQLLLKWALQHGFPVLPKSTSHQRILENKDLFRFTISDKDMLLLDGLDQNTSFAWPFDPCSIP